MGYPWGTRGVAGDTGLPVGEEALTRDIVTIGTHVHTQCCTSRILAEVEK